MLLPFCWFGGWGVAGPGFLSQLLLRSSGSSLGCVLSSLKEWYEAWTYTPLLLKGRLQDKSELAAMPFSGWDMPVREGVCENQALYY